MPNIEIAYAIVNEDGELRQDEHGWLHVCLCRYPVDYFALARNETTGNLIGGPVSVERVEIVRMDDE